MTVGNAMNWTGGTMSGAGSTIVAAGATLNLAVPSSVSLGRGLENAGTVLWTGAGSFGFNGRIITNRPGGLFEAQNAGTFTFVVPGSRIDNVGTFRKSVSSGTTTVGSGVSLNNYGSVDLQTGTLLCNGTYASSSSALLSCAIAGTNAGTGYARLQAAGAVTLNGNLFVHSCHSRLARRRVCEFLFSIEPGNHAIEL